MQRLRLRYAKRGRLRFSSHRDFQRAFERALRRAGVPMAYSAGFSPHPKISYAGAAPTGTASEAEYLEIAVVERCDPGWLHQALDASLPPGLDVLEVVEAVVPGLADRLQASRWRVALPGLGTDVLGSAVDAFLAAESVQVERVTKKGRRAVEPRAAVIRMAADHPGNDGDPPGEADPCAILDLVVRHVTPAVRPDDVLAGLRRVADLAPPVPPGVTRLAQGPLDEGTGTVTDPLAADRAAIEAVQEQQPGNGRGGAAPGPVESPSAPQRGAGTAGA
ncbi:MAG: TIGR03936 family radical SAM-associated protein [Actinomycetes bacterium]